MPKRVAVGVVASDKMAKTRRVEIPRLVRHAKYGKYHPPDDGLLRPRRTQRVVAGRHGGDRRVAAASKMKRWELVRVIAKSSSSGPGCHASRASRGGRTETSAASVEG